MSKQQDLLDKVEELQKLVDKRNEKKAQETFLLKEMKKLGHSSIEKLDAAIDDLEQLIADENEKFDKDQSDFMEKYNDLFKQD